ncbi:MAG TPA: hypothetical protein VGF48_05870 [Thermoanaerobaculia bacterium]
MPQISIETIEKNLESDRRFRERRHQQWTDNYLLDRDIVITNRLTQRQSVNVPLMKETRKTILASSEPQDIYFENLDNDGQKELLMNEWFKHVAERERLELLNEIDKKQEFLYGRSFWKLNIMEGRLRFEIIDPQDVLVDRYVNPWDLESARRITHTGIFRTLSDVERNALYDKAAIEELKRFFASEKGLITAAQNAELAADRSKRIEDMGVPDAQMPILGETYVELNECQMKVWDEAAKEDVVHVVVTANNNQILMDKPLRDILGVNEYTWVSWASDVDRLDFWSDGTADVVRVPNQIMNVYFSQLIENGVLRGYGMNFYDATKKEGWSPIGYVPAPFGFYPLPGSPKEVLQHVEVPELKSHLEEINLMRQMVETATAATSIQKGEGDESSKTLGEIQLLAQKATSRISAINKFLKQRDVDLGNKVALLVNANPDLLADVVLHKKSKSGRYFPRTVKSKELVSKTGYRCRVTQKAQKDADTLETIQKTRLVASAFPMNAPLQTILKEKMLDLVDLTPEQKQEVMAYQDQMPGMMPGAPGQPGAPALSAPVEPRRTVEGVINQGIPTNA